MNLRRKLFWLWLIGTTFWIGLEFLEYWLWWRCFAVPSRPLCQVFTTDTLPPSRIHFRSAGRGVRPRV